MNDMSCPVAKIKSSHPEHGGYMLINESDFDPAKHERFEEPPLAPPPGASAAVKAPPVVAALPEPPKA